MKKLLKIVLLSSIPLVMFSCYYDEFPEEIVVEIPEEQVISFKDEIEPMFAADNYNCVQCHSQGGQSPNLTTGSAYNALVPTYVIPGDALNSKLVEQLNENHQGGVSNNDQLKIEKWINDGADNN